jgi:hypothetical protein
MCNCKIHYQGSKGKNKIVVGLGQFPMTLTDMIVHENEDKALAQYSNKFWTNDPLSLLNCYYIC